MTMNELDVTRAQRVLVVKLSSLGDVVHVTPCLNAIRQSVPHAEIVMAVDRRFSAVVRHNPHVDRVIEASDGRIGPMPDLLRIREELSSFRDRPFDVAIDFQGTRRSAMWVYASRATWKAGRGKVRPGWTLALQPDLNKHAILVCAEIANAVGVRVVDLHPEIFLSEKDDQELLATLKEHGAPEDGFVIVNPFNRWPSKTWPFERYAQTVRRLREDFRVPVVITGGPGEGQEAAEFVRYFPAGTAISLVGELSLDQALCLYRRALLMVTGDSGPMHAAAALGTRVVALFGPTLPERTGPWGEGHRVIQKMRPPFHHAYRADGGRMYMQAIDVETVYAAIAATLQPLVSERSQQPMLAPRPTTNQAVRDVR